MTSPFPENADSSRVVAEFVVGSFDPSKTTLAAYHHNSLTYSSESLARALPLSQPELQTMAQSQSFIGQPSTSQFSPFVEMHQSIPSQVEAISPFLDQLMRFIGRFRSEDGSETDIEIAIREALTNAIVHGNHQNPEKRVYVASCCSQDGEVLVTIRDLGEGFDSHLVPDPTTPENRLSAHGRGIYLMQALMDEVKFEERGTVVKLRKQSNSSRSSPEQMD